MRGPIDWPREEQRPRRDAAPAYTAYAARIHRIQQRIRERPVLDARSADEIIGYGPSGFPE